MMDDPMFASTAGDFDVERRLDAFARARLSPAPGSKARARARIMREARLVFEAQATARTMSARIWATPTPRRPVLRRSGGLLLAATLTLGVAGGAMAASDAGGPLYPTRVWFETISLPSNASDRADAEIDRLDARLSELSAAAMCGDQAGVEAALLAYQQIADEALTGAASDADLTERLVTALNNHVTVLQGVAANVPPQAAAAIARNIERAIDHNDAVIERSLTQPASSGPGAGPNANPSPDSNPNGGTPPDKSPKPTTEPAPAAGATPHPTPTFEPPKGPPSEKPAPDASPGGQGGHPTP
jgi:hypothetical protein